MRVQRSFFALAAALGAATIASADIAYNNFGPGNSGFEYGGGGLFIGKFSSNTVTLQQGFQFEAGASGIITAVYVAVSFAAPPENGAGAMPTFDIYTNNGSDEIGTLIDTWTGTTPVGSQVMALTGGGASLTAGQKYWIVAREPDSTRLYGWEDNNQGFMSKKTISFDDGQSFFYDDDPRNQGAFRIDVGPTSVPEPFTMALMGGAAVAGYRRVRRRRA